MLSGRGAKNWGNYACPIYHERGACSNGLLINRYGLPFQKGGIESMMNRLQAKVGFRVHAHAFRHTFATVATQLGWNFERLRSAMGHADYTTLQRYVRLSMERDLGRLEDWLERIASLTMSTIQDDRSLGHRV